MRVVAGGGCSRHRRGMGHLRRLLVEDQLFLWTMRWSYDRDGERIVHLSVLHAEEGKPRGQPVQARFLARRPTLVDTAAALPGDARAAVDHARARGWDGARSLWLLPGCGFDRPDLVLSTPTRLRAWAGRAPLLALHVDDAGLAGALATELAAAPEPSAAQGAERHWHGERCFVLRGRFGGVTVYARRTTDIAATLAAVRRFAPKVGCSLRALGWKLDEASPAEAVPSPSAWEQVRGATRYRGPRDMDAIWVIGSGDDVRIEEFDHHPEAPGRLWRWFCVHAGRVVERRFPNGGGRSSS